MSERSKKGGGAVLSAQTAEGNGAVLRRPGVATPRLGEILVKAGVVSEDTIRDLLEQQRTGGTGRLGSLLIQKSLCTHSQIREALRK